MSRTQKEVNLKRGWEKCIPRGGARTKARIRRDRSCWSRVGGSSTVVGEVRKGSDRPVTQGLVSNLGTLGLTVESVASHWKILKKR